MTNMDDFLALARDRSKMNLQSAVQGVVTRLRLFPTSGAAVLPVATGYCVMQGRGTRPHYSFASWLGLNGRISEKDVEAVETFYQTAGLPTIINVVPEMEHALLIQLLHRGYRVMLQVNNWFRKLTGELLPALPPVSGLTIEVPSSSEDRLWSEIITRGFNENADPTEADFVMYLPWMHRSDGTCFLARLNGDPVGAANMILQDGLVRLQGASVLPEFRNRGIQKALIHERLRLATLQGASIAEIGGLPRGPTKRNAERFGFHYGFSTLKLECDFVV